MAPHVRRVGLANVCAYGLTAAVRSHVAESSGYARDGARGNATEGVARVDEALEMGTRDSEGFGAGEAPEMGMRDSEDCSERRTLGQGSIERARLARRHQHRGARDTLDTSRGEGIGESVEKVRRLRRWRRLQDKIAPSFVPDVSACFASRSLASFSSPSRRFAPRRRLLTARGETSRFAPTVSFSRRRSAVSARAVWTSTREISCRIRRRRRRAWRTPPPGEAYRPGVLGVVVETSPARIERFRRGRRGSRRRRFSHHARLFRRRGVRGVLRLRPRLRR